MAGTMKRAAVVIVLLALAACAPLPPATHEAIADWRSGKPDADCESPGHSSQWQADYCMAAMQTDDVVAAEPCLEHERLRRLGEECAARRHYKQDWCRLVVRNGGSGQSFAQCIADPEAAGPTVKSGGLD
jgi:hypothetical protein